jgi:hypothetical protein
MSLRKNREDSREEPGNEERVRAEGDADHRNPVFLKSVS